MGFGSMSGANSSLKYNRSIKRKHRKGFKDMDADLTRSKKDPLKFKEVSEEELEIIKQNIRKKGKKSRIQILTITIVLSSIVLFGIYKLLF
ncbi:MAG: hypothetical protein COA67_04315 [Lutibacter sp.]|nr:MAG: hypothetical protein COA67_04315 [Lutibacter sp.]